MAKVIAEFCQNHLGDKEILRDMIAAAAEAGADYAKIQTIHADDLTYRPRFEEGGEGIDRPYRPEYDRLSELEFPIDEYGWFEEECCTNGIEPLTTVFTQKDVSSVTSFGWDAVKVASYDCGSLPLLRRLKEHFDHLFVSTGATYDEEIEDAAEVLADTSFTFLHCVTIYPTPLDEFHLNRMEYLRQFTSSVGLSDHSLVERDGIKASAVALHLGADVVERHFTVLPRDRTKDGPVSIDPGQLETLCELAHGSDELRRNYVEAEVGDYSMMMGDAHRELTPEEERNRDYYRGRFASKLDDGTVVYNWESMEEAG